MKCSSIKTKGGMGGIKVSKVEGAINDWLAINSGINIKFVTQVVTGTGLITTIFYEG